MTKPLAPTTIGERQAIAEAATDALLLSHARLRCALEMIAAGHGCPMALAEDTLKGAATPMAIGELTHATGRSWGDENGSYSLPPTTTNVPVADREAVERVRTTLWMSHHYWLLAAREALRGDLGKLRKHVAISEGMTRETVCAEMEAALRQTLPIHGEMREALEALHACELWVTAALECKDWHWDADQHEAATESRDRARALRNALTSNTGSSS